MSSPGSAWRCGFAPFPPTPQPPPLPRGCQHVLPHVCFSFAHKPGWTQASFSSLEQYEPHLAGNPAQTWCESTAPRAPHVPRPVPRRLVARGADGRWRCRCGEDDCDKYEWRTQPNTINSWSAARATAGRAVPLRRSPPLRETGPQSASLGARECARTDAVVLTDAANRVCVPVHVIAQG